MIRKGYLVFEQDNSGMAMNREHHDRDDLAERRDRRRHTALRSTAMDAACVLLCEQPATPLTMAAVAARAGVSETTLGALFTSVSELIAEVCLRAVRNVAPCAHHPRGHVVQVMAQLRRMARLLEPGTEVVAVCATALMGGGPELLRIRDQIGHEVRGLLLSSALGPGAWPEVVSALELSYAGAMAHGAYGMDYRQAAERLETTAALIVQDTPQR